MKAFLPFTLFSLCTANLLLSSCVSLENKLMRYDKKTNELLKSMTGQPINQLIAKIGTPRDSINGLSSDKKVIVDVLSPEKNQLYSWKIQNYSGQRWVKTGPMEYAGSTYVGTYRNGHNVYQDHYRSVGYDKDTFDTCLVNVYTDTRGIIIPKSALGNTKALGGWCDEFLGLK